jgi:hypothetical protein
MFNVESESGRWESGDEDIIGEAASIGVTSNVAVCINRNCIKSAKARQDCSRFYGIKTTIEAIYFSILDMIIVAEESSSY